MFQNLYSNANRAYFIYKTKKHFFDKFFNLVETAYFNRDLQKTNFQTSQHKE